MSSLTQRVSVLGASTAVAGAALLGGVPMTHFDAAGLFHGVQRDVALTTTSAVTGADLDTTTFAGSLQWLLDNALGIGGKKLGDLVPPNATVDGLLAGSQLSHDSSMTAVFNQLGLDNFKVSDLLAGLGMGPDKSLDDVLGQSVLGLGISSMLSPLGLSASTTIGDMVQSGGPLSFLGEMTVGGLLGQLLPPGAGTVDGLLSAVGLADLQGLLTLLGVDDTTTTLSLLQLLGANTPDLTLAQLLGPEQAGVEGSGFLSSIGAMSALGMVGINDGTTIGDILNNLQVGDAKMGEIVGMVGITPDMTLAGLLSALPLGPNGLGGDTLGEVLALLNGGTAVDDTTLLSGFLDNMTGGLDFDHLIGLVPPDVTP